MLTNIGLSEYMNCVLVDKDVRNAMLLQAADYKEASHLDRTTQRKLKYISEYFPNLIQSPLEMGNVLISKKSYTQNDVSTCKKMGDILGYPSDLDDVHYMIDISATFYNSNKHIQIFGMVAKEGNYPMLDTFTRDALRVLKMDPLLGSIKDIICTVKPIIKEQDVIDKLILKIELSENDIYTIRNSMFNIGFSALSKYAFDYKNPIHIGILSTLLSYSINDPIMAFAPLQRFPKEYKMVDRINEKLELNIICNLNKSLQLL
jgi:hypothetical protein